MRNKISSLFLRKLILENTVYIFGEMDPSNTYLSNVDTLNLASLPHFLEQNLSLYFYAVEEQCKICLPFSRAICKGKMEYGWSPRLEIHILTLDNSVTPSSSDGEKWSVREKPEILCQYMSFLLKYKEERSVFHLIFCLIGY